MAADEIGATSFTSVLLASILESKIADKWPFLQSAKRDWFANHTKKGCGTCPQGISSNARLVILERVAIALTSLPIDKLAEFKEDIGCPGKLTLRFRDGDRRNVKYI